MARHCDTHEIPGGRGTLGWVLQLLHHQSQQLWEHTAAGRQRAGTADGCFAFSPFARHSVPVSILIKSGPMVPLQFKAFRSP